MRELQGADDVNGDEEKKVGVSEADNFQPGSLYLAAHFVGGVAMPRVDELIVRAAK